MENDTYWMKRVLRLAAKGRGRTSPNPMVGALLVKGDKIIGEGYHAKAGTDHAEIVALRNAGKEAREATLYLNLEPCTHYGKTPPCLPAVIEARVKRVVVGMEDPNPLVTGRGLEGLKQAGINVEAGVLEKECRQLNEAFCKYIPRKEPFVILKAAATLDGKIATREGDSKWISGEMSRSLVHRMRDQVDGVVIGIGTVLRDDPLLTARIKNGRDPFRIVLDSQLRVPEEAKVIGEFPSKTVIATTELGAQDKMARLKKKGVQVMVLESQQGRVPLKHCLSQLGEMGMMSLLVEGGSQVNSSFLEEGLIDKVLLFFSPRLLGDNEALGIFSGARKMDLTETIPLDGLRVKRIGEDILVEGYPMVPQSRQR